MTLGSAEFYDMINNFEKNIEYLPYGVSFEKEDKELWKIGQVYRNGQTNYYFMCYRLGYSAGRIAYMQQ